VRIAVSQISIREPRTLFPTRWVASVGKALAWTAIVAGPLVLFASFHGGHVHDPQLAGPTFHFYVVSLTSFVVLVLAVLMRIAAGHLNDPRALFLSFAFLSISGVFLVHALTTPAVLVPSMNPWVGFSARLSLFLGAGFLVLASVNWAPRTRGYIVRSKRMMTSLLIAALAVYGMVALVTSFRGSDFGEYGALLTGDPVSYALTGITLLMLGIVIARYVLISRISSSPLLVGILVSSILLAHSKVSMTIAPVWHASWWAYHVLMLVGFCAALGGLLWEYSGSRNLRGAIGDLLRRDSLAEVQRGYTDVILALIEAVEAKDPYTRGHTQGVSELVVLIAQHLGLGAEEQRVVNRAALLHDIGKIGIPDAVLNKPGGLTDEEFSLIRDHPLRGYQMIKHVHSLKRESDGVRYHHERMDGSGYPNGLVGDEIPLVARIIAVADMFDALTTARPYRPAFPFDAAIRVINSESGTKLDSDCVQALLDALPVWRSHARQVNRYSRTMVGVPIDAAIALNGSTIVAPSPRHPAEVN
jgi:hypothetical protein